MGTSLSSVPVGVVRLDGNPFGVVSAGHRWSFVSVGDRVALLSDRGLAPALVRTVTLPPASDGSATFPRAAAGETLTHNGRDLLVAGDRGAVVLSVGRLERGAGRSVLGTLATPGPALGSQLGPGDGGIEVITSPGDRYAFVTLENAGEIAVFDLRAALEDRFRRFTYIGSIRLGQGPVGMAISSDGRWLYATSLTAAATGPISGQGSISVIDLRRAETKPSAAVVNSVHAGCGTVRVVMSPDRHTVWATAQASNALLGFSASKLVSDPRHALVADVRIGASPAGLAFADDGRRIVVADTDRYDTLHARPALSVVSPSAALHGKPALLGAVNAGSFPREMSLEPNGRILLVTNYESDRVEAVDTDQLP